MRARIPAELDARTGARGPEPLVRLGGETGCGIGPGRAPSGTSARSAPTGSRAARPARRPVPGERPG